MIERRSMIKKELQIALKSFTMILVIHEMLNHINIFEQEEWRKEVV